MSEEGAGFRMNGIPPEQPLPLYGSNTDSLPPMSGKKSWKPEGVDNVRGKYIDQYPDRVEGRDWWLLGTRTHDSAVYFDTDQDRIVLVEQNEEGELVEQDTRPISELNTVWQEVTSAASGEFGWDTWSRYSWPSYVVSGLVGRSRAVVGDEQLATYVYRELYDIPRKEVAEFLGKSPHTIDNQLSDARRKIRHAQEFLQGLHKDRQAPVTLDV